MIVIRDLIPGVRDWLGNPPKGKLSNTSILLGMYDEIDHFRSKMNLANVGWSLAHTDIQIGGGKEEVNVEGKVPLGNVVLVTTWDGSDTTFTTDEVPVTSIQAQDRYYVGPRVEDNYNSASPHAVRVFTFTRDASTGNVTAIVKPSHQAIAAYRIWYQPDRPEPSRLNDRFPLLEAFTNLFKVRVAIGRLPKLYETKTIADKEVSNMEWIKLTMGVLTKKEAEYEAVFDAALKVPVPQQAGDRVGYGHRYDDGVDLYYT